MFSDCRILMHFKNYISFWGKIREATKTVIARINRAFWLSEIKRIITLNGACVVNAIQELKISSLIRFQILVISDWSCDEK